VDTAQLLPALNHAMGGKVDASPLTRGMYSTDASNYRVPPLVVVFPRDVDELAAVADVSRALEVPLTMRGGGTSCAGNAVGPGIVVDASKHLNRILALDPEARTARVQCGVVMDALQAKAARHGLRFGPDPSTHSRATFGGMIGNNACGNHAVAYGRTSDNVLELELIDGKGHKVAAGQGLDAVPGLEELAMANLAVLRTEFGRFGRQVSGYGLEHLLPEKGGWLARALVGTEGTCGIVTAATVRLVEAVQDPVLVVLGYPDMPVAADSVPALLPHRPLALEGLDHRLIDIVRRRRGDAAVPDLPDGGAWLMVELDPAMGSVDDLLRDAGALDHRVLPQGAPAKAMWRIREDGAGLGGRTPSGRQGWPGFEDAAVPPDRLGAYLRRFDALLEEFGLDGLPYGHLGDGCVHIRIDFPLDRDGKVFRQFMEAGADLVVEHGGSLSGEHGDGRARGELLSKMYSPAAVALMAQFKGLFDPLGLLNPGVVVEPAKLDADLRRPSARPQPAASGFQFTEDGGDLTNAVHRCTGVAKCRADIGGFMCPSYLATGEEKDSTRGRARVLQELANGSLLGGGLASSELAQALEFCLACKACSAECPAAVDMARLKSETLHRSLKGRLRPAGHYSLGWLPRWTRLATRMPGLANLVLHLPLVSRLAKAAAGLDRRRLLPKFAPTGFHALAQADGFEGLAATVPAPPREFPGLRRMGASGPVQAPEPDQAARPVLLWADSFSSALAPEVPLAVARLLEQAGHTVYVVGEDVCCGLTWITTGQLGAAKRRLAQALNVLGPFAVNGWPIVGVEPSCTAVLRGDLPDLLPGDPRAAAVAKATKTLAEVLTQDLAEGAWRPPRLDGREIVVQPHCHHHAVMGYAPDIALLEGLGAKLTRLAGCCGMAGNFGMERGHYEVSLAVAQRSLLPALAGAGPGAVLLADGFSCRTQAHDLAGAQGLHLAQLLVADAG
jgi:FAD/FMN-containing dehydrogenase/Fe-S oxidoreductase